MSKPVVLSGIQPTGGMTIGNYVGAINQWLKLQEDHESFFMLVDLHAITVRQEPELLRSRVLDGIALTRHVVLILKNLLCLYNHKYLSTHS